MEQFEEVNSSDPVADRRLNQNVEELESEAFNRGLPEKAMAPLSSGENGFAMAGDWTADDVDPADPANAAPRYF